MMPARHDRRASAGFSLIEAMVAVSILAMIGIASFGTITRSMDARERATQMTDRYGELRQALARMSQEISQAFLSMHKDYSDPRTATLFATRRSLGSNRLDFTSFSHFKYMADANECDQNELSYYIEVDAKDPKQKNLMRREQNRIDEHPDEGGRAQVLAHDVTALDFLFYDAKTDRWEENWDSTSQDHRNRLPKFIKIVLTTTDQTGKPMKLSTKTRTFLKEAILIPGSGFAPGID
jgi:general secretion pathway protein J